MKLSIDSIKLPNHFTILFCFFYFFITPSVSEAQISGVAFSDYNASETTSNANEPLMANVNFKAYKSKGTFSTLNDKSSETNYNRPITASGFNSPPPTKSNNDEGSRAFVITCSATSTEIRGNVFHDLNYNGVKDATETTGQSGITVTATDSLGTTFTATTNASGDYTLSGLNTIRTYRVVFTNLPTWASPTNIGSDNSTTVQFLKPGNCANLGLANGGEYCETNPTLVIPCYLTGLANSTTATTDPAIVKLPFDNSAAQTYLGTVSQFGTVNGVAWQSDANRLFLASFLKRYSGFAQGPGYIYTVDNPKGASPTVSSFNLQGVSPANGGAALNFGSVCRRDAFDGDPNATCDPLGTGIAADYTLVSNPTSPARDLDAFLKIGTMSYGDADYDSDNRLLWVVNLFQKGLISIDVSGSTGSLPGTVNQYLIASLPGIPTCTGGTLRPFGLKFYRGKGYLGVVCDASTSQNVANLDAFILTFDPKNVAAGFQTALSFDLNYPRETAFGTNSAAWKPWRVSGTAGSYSVYPQPLVSDIDFTSKGEMIIGLMDRNAQSGGFDNYEPVSNSTALYFVSAAGDLLKACPNGSGFVMEGYTGCMPTLSDTYTTDGATNTDGPNGGGEFFFQDYAENGHNENNLGNIAVLGEKVVSNAYNPVLVSIFMNGLQWYNTTTGADIGNKTLIDYTIDGSRSGKAGGLGDIELLCTTAPLEIGNRVWLDTNKNGVQDAGETGIGNIQIQLFADFNNDGVPDGAALATTTTSATAGNALGSWYFNAANVTDGDPTVAGNQAGPQPNKRYLIRIGSTDWAGGVGTGDLTGLILSTDNVGGAGNPDVQDSDAVLVSSIPTISYLVGNVGQSDHTLDMGFIACPTITNPSATQTVCLGATGSNITVNTDYNTTNGIRFVKFTSDQSATNGSETTTELANIYAGTATSTVTPTGASSPYTATYTFNAADFPTAGTYYVYAVLNPDLGASCRPVQEIIININGVTASVVAGDQTICSGGNPAAFTVTTAATGSGTLTYQWQSSTTGCAGTFTNISGANSATYDPPSGLTATTNYRVIVTSTLNSVACTATSNCLTVTVNSVTASVVSGDQTICSGGDPSVFTVSTAATGSGTLTYQWQSSTTGCAGTFTNILGANSATYDVPSGLTATTNYRVIVTSTLNSVACTATSNCLTVTVNSVTASVVSGDQTICSGGNPAAFTVTTAATGSGILTYQWQSSTTGCAGTFTNISGANSATYDPPSGLTATTNYRVIVTSTLNSVACTATSNCLTVTVNSVTASVVAGDQTICSGGDPAAFTVTTAATGSGTLTYQWQSSTTGCAGTFTNISGANSATYDVPSGLTATTNYRVIVTSTLNSVACTATSNCLTVTVNSVTASVVSGDQTICSGGDPAAFTVTTAAIGSGTLTYQWQSSTTGCAGTFTNISGANSATYDPPSGLTATTNYRVIVTSTLNSVACTATSNCLTVTVNSVTASVVSGDQTICSGGNPAAFTITTAATGSGILTYQWQSSTTGCAGTFTNISGANSATYDAPSGLTATTNYRVIVTSTLNSVACTATSNCLTVTVNSVTASVVSGDQTICSGGNPAAFTITTAATGSGILTYQWQSSTTGCAGTFTNISGANSATYDAPSGLTATTNYRVIVTSTLNSVACTATSNCLTVTVNSVTASVVSGDQTICSGGDPAAFTVTTAATGSGILTYQWQSSTTGCAGTFTNISGANSATYDVPSGLTATTNYRVIVTSTLNSVACTATSNCLTVTINPQPTTPSVSNSITNSCPLTTVDLTAISAALTPSVSGGVFEWHVSNSSGSAIVSNQTAVVAGDYYLFERSPANCYSTGLKVTVSIQVCCPAPACIPVLIIKQ